MLHFGQTYLARSRKNFLEHQGLRHVRDRYPGLSEHRPMVQLMWQADLYGVAEFVTDCLGYIMTLTPGWVGLLIRPRWLEET